MKARFVKKSCAIGKIHSLGAEGNDVGLKKHHGGVDKALFFMSADSFNELNTLLNKDFFLYGYCDIRRKFCRVRLE